VHEAQEQGQIKRRRPRKLLYHGGHKGDWGTRSLSSVLAAGTGSSLKLLAPAHSSNPPPTVDETVVLQLLAVPRAALLRRSETSVPAALLRRFPDLRPARDFQPQRFARCTPEPTRSHRQNRNQRSPGNGRHPAESPG